MSTAVTIREQRTELSTQLDARLATVRDMLPQNYSIARFKAVAMNTVAKSPALLDCDRGKLLLAFLRIAEMGLEPTAGQVSIIPYGKEPQVIVEYGGKLQLLYNSGIVKDINVEVVREGDKFKRTGGDNPSFRHEMLSKTGDKLVGVYAVARLTSGGVVRVYCDANQVAKHKACSRAKNGPWQDWEEEMWRKTALHALYKVLPRSYQMQVSQDVDDELLTTASEPQSSTRPWQGGAVLHSDSALPGLLSDLADVSRDTIPTWTEQHVDDINALSDEDRKALSDAIADRQKKVTP